MVENCSNDGESSQDTKAFDSELHGAGWKSAVRVYSQQGPRTLIQPRPAVFVGGVIELEVETGSCRLLLIASR